MQRSNLAHGATATAEYLAFSLLPIEFHATNDEQMVLPLGLSFKI